MSGLGSAIGLWTVIESSQRGKKSRKFRGVPRGLIATAGAIALVAYRIQKNKIDAAKLREQQGL